MKEWIERRGGVAVWGSIDFSGRTWSTPARLEEGDPTPKPHWAATEKPISILTSIDEVEVDIPKLVKRFHIGLRRGSQGLTIKLTDASSARLRRECDKAGENSWYEFDYDTQDALIFVPDKTVSLSVWKE